MGVARILQRGVTSPTESYHTLTKGEGGGGSRALQEPLATPLMSIVKSSDKKQI